MMAEEPDRMTELSALLAARFAMVPVLVILPPVRELTMFFPTALATVDAAAFAALWPTFFRLSACRSASRSAAFSSFRRAF